MTDLVKIAVGDPKSRMQSMYLDSRQDTEAMAYC